MTSSSPHPSISSVFADIDDPRVVARSSHLLIDVLTIAVCAILCGAEGWADMELFGKSKEEWLRTFLKLPNGIPSHDTFARIFAAIDPDQFRECFIRWTQSLMDIDEDLIAVDGKTLRGSRDKGKSAVHIVSAWASANSLVLGQYRVDEKSNEITAIPELLRMGLDQLMSREHVGPQSYSQLDEEGQDEAEHSSAYLDHIKLEDAP